MVVSEGDDDANDSYEDVEARLQQERIDHLQTMRKRSELESVICNSFVPCACACVLMLASSIYTTWQPAVLRGRVS